MAYLYNSRARYTRGTKSSSGWYNDSNFAWSLGVRRVRKFSMTGSRVPGPTCAPTGIIHRSVARGPPGVPARPVLLRAGRDGAVQRAVLGVIDCGLHATVASVDAVRIGASRRATIWERAPDSRADCHVQARLRRGARFGSIPASACCQAVLVGRRTAPPVRRFPTLRQAEHDDRTSTSTSRCRSWRRTRCSTRAARCRWRSGAWG